MRFRVLLCALLGLAGALLGGTGLAGAQTPAPDPPALPLPPAADACGPGSPIPACGPPETPQAPAPVPGQPAAPLPLPPQAPEACEPGSPIAACHLPEPGVVSPPTPIAPPPPPRPLPPMGDPASPGCGFSNIPACVSEAMTGFFTDLVAPGLNEVLELLGATLLVTPELDDVPVMGEIWEHSRQVVLVSYSLVVTMAGLVVLAYQTLQTRSSIKEVLPRIAVGFIAANLSMLVASYAIDLANAFSRAILGNMDPDQIGQSMADTFLHDLDSGALFLLLIALALLVMLVVVLLTYVVRIMLTIILLAAAPLLLMCHALPQTEGIAFWWWKAFAGTLVIQIGQSFALIAAMKLFFLPGGITVF